MSGTQPVLVSIKSDWEEIADHPIVGKDVLELLSSSMYVNPLAIYREYVQNATDSIEEATGLGLLSRREMGRVDIKIDADKRTVSIRDNGTGIEKAAFTRALVALGASRKRGTKARGFRGVGRLAGLGYCRELVFRSLADGEHVISEMRWDCQRLKTILRDVTFKGGVDELIKEVVRIQRRAATQRGHFFEVELSGIVRHGDDRLMNSEAVRDYLSQVAPVPFSPSFKFGKQIEEYLSKDVNLGTVRIYLNNEEQPLFRAYQNVFEARKGVTDEFADIRFFEIKATDGGLAAKGWVLDHGYFGAIDRSTSIMGLRLRSGNMQVGEGDVLGELFTESRFNAWVAGEFHVLDNRILPNGRRDHFEQNVHFSNLLAQLRPIAHDLSRRCRQSSIRRNIIRQFEILSDQVVHKLSIMRQGAIRQAERKKLHKDALREIAHIEKIAENPILDPQQKKRVLHSASRYRRQLHQTSHTQQHQALAQMNDRDRTTFRRVCSLIYECSANKAAAKQLIDRILAKI
jgi:Histidine kinase-, DNA gyrase B-, and HSP90-like ATPase